MTEPDTARNIWYMRIRHQDTEPPEETLVGVASEEYADGSVVDLETHGPWPLRPDRLVRVRYAPGSNKIRSLRVVAASASVAPQLRFVAIPEPDGARPAFTLVAFPADDDSVGSVYDVSEFAALGLPGTDQVAAIRWYPDTGLIHQIYVAPQHRRSRIGTAMILAAAGLRAARGWPALHADGRRTAQGEAFALGGPSQWHHRVPDLTETMPPMTR